MSETLGAASRWRRMQAGSGGMTLLAKLAGYILWELLRGMLLALLVFSLILVAVFLGQVMRDGVGVFTLIEIIPNFIPMICPFVMPISILTGILLCYSRLAKDNEIMAAYAGGAHPFWLMVPAFLLSGIAIFVSLTLNVTALETAIGNIERLVRGDQVNILSRMLAKPGNITVPTGEEYVAMSKPDGPALTGGGSPLDITRFSAPDPGESGTFRRGRWDTHYPYPTKRVVARNHEIQSIGSEGEKDVLLLKMGMDAPVFQDLHERDVNKVFVVDGEHGEERIPVGGGQNVTIHSNRSAFWSIFTLQDKRNEARQRLQEVDRRLTEMPDVQREMMEFEAFVLRRAVLNHTAEIHLRLALSFSCIAFAVMGIPLGMRTSGSVTNSFAIGIAISGAYFLVLKGMEFQVAKGLVGAWAIWLPNVLVIGLGAILWRRGAV